MSDICDTCIHYDCFIGMWSLECHSCKHSNLVNTIQGYNIRTLTDKLIWCVENMTTTTDPNILEKNPGITELKKVVDKLKLGIPDKYEPMEEQYEKIYDKEISLTTEKVYFFIEKPRTRIKINYQNKYKIFNMLYVGSWIALTDACGNIRVGRVQ